MSNTCVLSRYPFHHDSFQSISKDQNRVPTGYLRGDACNCEPQARIEFTKIGRMCKIKDVVWKDKDFF